MSNTLTIPSHIPWARLKQSELEECLYWLLDDLGAKDIEWRKGGTGEGAPDQGRDLEATFFAASPDGALDGERWWVEAKGRSKTVEPGAVKDAAVNCESQNDVAVLVIATNSRFSNPTRDWVKQWQLKHPRPRLRLWDRDALERMLVRHPSVVLRMFSEALAPQGQLEAIRSRFWNQCHLTTRGELATLWGQRGDLSISPEAAIALVAGEIANGNLSVRPWLMTISDRMLGNALRTGIVNLFYILSRAERLGTNTSPIEAALANVLMTALVRLPFREVWGLLQGLWSETDQDVVSPEFQQATLRCCVNRMVMEMAAVCSVDCKRVTNSSQIVPDQDKFDYWDRFRMPDEASYEKAVLHESTGIVIEDSSKDCGIGLPLANAHCPLIGPAKQNVTRRTLETYRAILARRAGR